MKSKLRYEETLKDKKAGQSVLYLKNFGRLLTYSSPKDEFVYEGRVWKMIAGSGVDGIYFYTTDRNK